MSAPSTRNWSAWENREPPVPPRPTMHVVGEVETANDDVVLNLVPTVPQGINPAILMLDLTLQDSGSGTGDKAYREVKYEKDVSPGEHTQVQIMFGIKSIETIEVTIAQ